MLLKEWGLVMCCFDHIIGHILHTLGDYCVAYLVIQ